MTVAQTGTIFYLTIPKTPIMIPMHDLKEGDIIGAEYEGTLTRGSVIQLDRELNQVCVVTNDDQECWYAPADLYPIHLGQEELEKLGFTAVADRPGNGAVTYVRGPFSIEVRDPGTLNELTLLYRNEAPRVFHNGLNLHELQNHYLAITNVHLVDRAALED
jgi:hypothetical protein